MKSCKDCRHYKPYAALADDALKDKYAFCGSPRSPHSGTHNLVVEHRRDGFVMAWINNTCGKRARWFEWKKPAHRPYDDVFDVHPPKPWPRDENDFNRLVMGSPGAGMSFPPLTGERAEGKFVREDIDQWQRDFDDFKRKNGVI